MNCTRGGGLWGRVGALWDMKAAGAADVTLVHFVFLCVCVALCSDKNTQTHCVHGWKYIKKHTFTAFIVC